jgi:hypothetical protein
MIKMDGFGFMGFSSAASLNFIKISPVIFIIAVLNDLDGSDDSQCVDVVRLSRLWVKDI